MGAAILSMGFKLTVLVTLLVMLSLQSASAYSVSCDDIVVDTDDITIESDDKEAFFFRIYNYSDEDFYIFQANVWRESGRYDISIVDYGGTVEEGGFEWITIEVESERVNNDSTGQSYIELRGQFDNGDYCGFGNIDDFYFDVTVEEGGTTGDVDCGNIEIKANNIHVDESSREIVSFTIENDTDEDFDLQGLELEESSSYFDVEVYSKPSEIRAGESATFRLRIDSERVSSNKQGTVTVEARGRFEGGEYCSLSEINEERFTVYVDNSGSTTPTDDCDEIEIDVSDVFIDEDSTRTVSFRIRNRDNDDFEVKGITLDESSSYFSARVTTKPLWVRAYDDAIFKVRIESDNVSSDRQGDVTVQVKGEFEDGEYCGYSDVTEEEFTVFVDNEGSGGTSPSTECEDVTLNASTVRVEKDTTKYATIFLENDNDEDFLIDYVSVFDSSTNFQAEENGYAKKVPAFGSSYINVKIRAYEYAETCSEDVFVVVKGHFQGEQECYLFDNEIDVFSVIIEEKQPDPAFPDPDFTGDCTYFSLIVPNNLQIENSGTVPITIDNRTGERATVRLYGPGLTLQPQLISVPRYTLVSEKISVSSTLNETSLTYTIDALGCNQSKTTRIVATGVEADQPDDGTDGETTQTGEIVEGLASGFFVLGQAGAMIGLLALVVLALYLIFRPKSA